MNEQQAPRPSKTMAERIAERVVLEVCELPDYNSPEGQPDLLTCTVRELEACVLRAFEQNEYDAEMARGPAHETNEHPALKAGDELAHQSVYSPLHERWWQARGGHDKCTVCVPGNPHTAEWFCLCGEPLPDPRADCPKCTPLKASTETLLQQPVAWRCKNGFGDWRYTSVSPVSSPYSPAYEPLYVRAESKASEQAGHHCGMLKAECKDEFCPTHGQDIR